VPSTPGDRALEPAPEGGTFEGPMTVSLYCATQGASVGYSTDTGDDPQWELYSGPIRLSAGVPPLIQASEGISISPSIHDRVVSVSAMY
jgi:hypothetical protein